MELLEILENLEKIEDSYKSISVSTRNLLRLTDKEYVLPWKNNYWVEVPLEDKPYYRRLKRLRKSNESKEKNDSKTKAEKRIRSINKRS